MDVKIINLTENDLVWTFEGNSPCFLYPSGDWSRQVKVDPFPCYAHDAALVDSEAGRSMRAFPIDRDVTFVLTDREVEGRTNGFTDIGYIYGGEKPEAEREWTATIVLSGKRIPIHPAMTRYLVAHEYGHVVSQYIRRARGKKDGQEYGEKSLYVEYQKIRGFTTAKNYGGRTWHASVQELFANDFRILVVGAETEFWPHPGFARPEDVPAVVDFWKSAAHA